jgi:membrane protein implicated in regulation of membrane protease activity
MGCLFAMFAGLFPRLGLFIIWIARPVFVDAAFDTFIWPLLGIIFLPFATLIYVLLLHARRRADRRGVVVGDSRRAVRHRPVGGQLHPAGSDPRDGTGRVNAGTPLAGASLYGLHQGRTGCREGLSYRRLGA